MESKTVLALGWSAYLNELSEQNKPIQSDIPSIKPKPQTPLPPRTLWTRCLEAVVEFSRVAFDLFYGIHYLSVVCADHVEIKNKAMITWELGDQRLSKLQTALASYERPFSDPQALAQHQTASCVNSLTESLKMVFLPTQTELQNPAKSFPSRILLISAVSNEAQLSEIQNNLATCLCSKTFLQHSQLDITLLNVHFDFCPNRPPTLPQCTIAPGCSFRCISCPGNQVSAQVMALCRVFYSLSSVIIKGIPMKEEQSKPAPSHHFDVELYHSQEAQRDFLRTSGCTTPPGVKQDQGELVFDFKWCSPKKSNLEFRFCSGSWRISPVLVSHRPTACLFTFLHQGNQVLLEHHRPQGTPADSPTPTPISFTLLTHNKAAFLHSIPHINHTPIDDPPPVPSSATSRAHESRVEEFVRLMERYKLAPLPAESLAPFGYISPCDQALHKLLFQNHQLPLTQSDSLLHQLSDRFRPILSTQELPSISEEAITTCKDLLSELDSMMRKGEPLIQTRTIPKGKREDNYMQLWRELIYLLDGSRRICEGAQQVYAHLLSLLQNLPQEHLTAALMQTFEEAKSETEKHMSQLAHVPQADQRVRRTLSLQESTGVKRKLDGFPIQQSFTPSRVNMQPPRQQISLLTMWSLNTEKDAKSRHVEFAGRANSTSNRAELYGLRTRDPMQGEHSLNL